MEPVAPRDGSPVPAGRMPVSLNEVWRQSLKKNEVLLRNASVTVRCELLPQVEGDPRQFQTLFDRLVSLILNHPPVGSRLFLYVDCQEEILEKDGAELKKWTLRFSTNIPASEEWRQAHQPVLQECEQIVARHNGEFTVNRIQNTGCLFVMNLYGKTDPCPQ
jgi:hypothetical protein